MKNNEYEYNKFVTSLLVVFVCLIVIGMVIFAFLLREMWIDHQCYIDGHYDTPQCQKYTKEDK